MQNINFLALVVGTAPVVIQGMDVDLRQLPAIVGKKRPSTEAVESSSAKKTKTEMFDV